MAMARRRTPAKVETGVMPEHLVAVWKSPERWRDDSEAIPDHASSPESWFEHQARRRFQRARGQFLSSLESKPIGVGDLEWHSAHGRVWDPSTGTYRTHRQEQS